MQNNKQYAPLIVRVILGLFFTVFGLNGFLNFMPVPEVSPAAEAFLGALAVTGYMFPLIKATELVAGLMLLSGRLVPLSLILLAPVTINILFFHTVLDPKPAMPILIIAAQLYLAYAYRSSYAGVLQANASPTARNPQPEAHPTSHPA